MKMLLKFPKNTLAYSVFIDRFYRSRNLKNIIKPYWNYSDYLVQLSWDIVLGFGKLCT